MKTWLILDCNYLCYRAFHSTGDLINGTLFGFLREVKSLQSTFGTDDLVFCFDHGVPLRKTIYPDYKASRIKEIPPDEQQARENMKEQVRLLKHRYLWDLGYKNIFFQKGYEADDIIASVIQSIPREDGGIIVSSDKDLYQLLSTEQRPNHKSFPSISIWKPQQKQRFTVKELEKEYCRISPEQWHLVKAIAGCTADNIPGVIGVGDLTAAKFLRGKLKEGSKSYRSIMEGEEVWKANIPLVKLPWPGVKKFELKENKSTSRDWRNMAEKLGMKSLVGGF